ncbi:MAG: nucleotide exchange factor GrpE [Bowdeniella nasicola]|nr:nucleotide exchange factor GrpE [Bowdeniella nasicola]
MTEFHDDAAAEATPPPPAADPKSDGAGATPDAAPQAATDATAPEGAAPAADETTRQATPSEADEPAPEQPEPAPEAEAAGPSIADLKAENARLADDLARARAAQYNTEQEYAGFVRRTREEAGAVRESGKVAVIEALFSVLDDIELARQHGDLEGTFATFAQKLENILEQRFQVTRFGAPGDPFDPEHHEALMASPGEVEVDTVAQVMQPGYQMGETILRPARVAVQTPQ